MISYQAGGIELVDCIKEMWEKLNLFHTKCSTYFGNEFPSITYDIRKQSFYEAGKQIFIIIAKDDDKNIGYCVATFINNKGEIESIYVDKDYRSKNIGSTLMQESLNWFKKNKINRIEIYVATGNENAYPFYEQFGFYPRVTKLTRKNPNNS